MRISDWSSDVCSSDLAFGAYSPAQRGVGDDLRRSAAGVGRAQARRPPAADADGRPRPARRRARGSETLRLCRTRAGRSEEHTSELQSLMRSSYAVFCLKNKNTRHPNITTHI